MGRTHSQLCHPVHAAINEQTEELIRHYEMQVGSLSRKHTKKIRRRVFHHVQSCIPIEFLEPNCAIYTAHGGLNARQRATLRALVNYAFLRAVHIRQTSNVLLLDGPPSISDLSSNITHGDTTDLERGNGTGTRFIVRNELTASYEFNYWKLESFNVYKDDAVISAGEKDIFLCKPFHLGIQKFGT
ncbi:hypothetical protein CRM22_002276 [Opisthorchis felineus]|uniref:Uncharacterized protein n=1 Tax=Opisthorchis felineus TaxID=147828 RepID=A0A4S2MCS5_OPIFE|nr:hypothetical protein CRM22_002276 [Opisthorchis felineus]